MPARTVAVGHHQPALVAAQRADQPHAGPKRRVPLHLDLVDARRRPPVVIGGLAGGVQHHHVAVVDDPHLVVHAQRPTELVGQDLDPRALDQELLDQRRVNLPDGGHRPFQRLRVAGFQPAQHIAQRAANVRESHRRLRVQFSQAGDHVAGRGPPLASRVDHRQRGPGRDPMGTVRRTARCGRDTASPRPTRRRRCWGLARPGCTAPRPRRTASRPHRPRWASAAARRESRWGRLRRGRPPGPCPPRTSNFA